MGGRGSGRRNQIGRNTTEDSLPLDIRRLKRSGVLVPGTSFSWEWTVNDKPVASIRVQVDAQAVLLAYRYRQRGEIEWQNVEQAIHMDRTACTYGGNRLWWRCPSCGKRVAVLYSPGKHYACRHCWQLTYACQQEGVDDRAARRADRIRRRLGWPVGIFNLEGGKPKRMRWRTYERLTAEHSDFVRGSLAGMAKRLGLPKVPRDDSDFS